MPDYIDVKWTLVKDEGGTYCVHHRRFHTHELDRRDRVSILEHIIDAIEREFSRFYKWEFTDRDELNDQIDRVMADKMLKNVNVPRET